MSAEASSLTAEDLAEIMAAEQIRLVIHPETVSRYMY
jgi:hypothetical protein